MNKVKSNHKQNRGLVYTILLLGIVLPSFSFAATYYVDPATGSPSNDGSASSPWRTIQEVFASGLFGTTILPGDTVLLRSGYHGYIDYSGGNNSDYIIIAAETGHTPQLRRIELNSCTRWIFRGLTISPELTPGAYTPESRLFDIRGSSQFITIEQCTLYSVADSSGWTASDWTTLAASGIYVDNSTNITARQNHIKNVVYGILMSRQNVLVEYNTVENFRADGLRGGAPDQTWQYNIVKNSYRVDDAHRDGIQIYSGGVPAYRTVIRGNIFIEHDNPNQPFIGDLMGISLFEAAANHQITIENNVVIVEAVNGIVVDSAVDSKIVNNIVFSRYGANVGQIHLRTSPQNTIVRNNIAYSVPANSGSVSSDHNFDLDNYNPDNLFVDWRNFDLRPRAGSPAIDAGSSSDAPNIDLEGTSRPQGAAYDIGAYEYTSGSSGNLPPNADAGPDQARTDTDGDGSEQISLNGLSSSDPDGSIVNYVWTEGGNQIATGATPTVTLAVGQHTITLQVTDDGGLTDTDTVVVTIETLASDTIAPSITSVTASQNSVEIQFSEPLDEQSATDGGNYGISGGVAINSVRLDSEYNRVTLSTTTHQQGVRYTLTVVNVEDAAGNAMALTTRDYVYTPGLVGHWTFDDSDNNSITDISGHNNTATAINGAAITAAGEAAFAGGNDAVQIQTADLNVAQGTIVLWANPSNQTGSQYLFGHTAGGWANRIQLYLSNGYLCVGLGNNHSLQTDIQLLNTQTWYHLALSWDGTNYAVYVDGQTMATGTYTGLTQLSTIADIGNTGNTSSRTEGFNGLIDEVRVYNRSLTSDEIADLALVFLPVGDKSVVEGNRLQFSVRTKPGAIVGLADHNLPSTPTFASNVFTWTPGYNDAGSYEAEFTAPNGSDTDYERITITVTDSQTFGEIGYWTFDETSGETANDSSSNNNTGYLRNGLDWGSGRINGAVVFSVPNDAVEISTADLNINAGTITMWVYVEKQTMSRHYLFGHAADALTNRIQLYLKYGNLCLGLADSHEIQKNIYQMQNLQWYHVALTWNATSYRVYVNGSARVIGTFAGLTGFGDHADIGNNGIYRDKALNGKIDDVRLYNRALSSTEIAELANGN